MRIEINTLQPDVFLRLYRSVGWEPPGHEQIETALKHSLATFTAYDGDTPLGMARLLGDAGMSFYVKDFAVLPESQRKGVGQLLLDALIAYIRDHKENNWAVSLELISSKSAIGFYKKNGFEERPCEWDGPGMIQMIR